MHFSTARIWRGAENQVFHTITGLRAAGSRAVLVAHPRGELYRRMADQPDVFAIAPNNEGDPRAIWRLSRLIRQLRPDVLHVHEPHGVSLAAAARRIAWLRAGPVLIASRRVATGISGNLLSKWKYGAVDCFFAISEAVRQRLIADGVSRDRVALIHSGVAVEAIAALKPADVRGNFRLPQSAVVVGSVGALAPEKGQQYLIEAAAIVTQQVPDSYFIICGEGELRQSLQEQIDRLNLRERVLLAGFRTDVPGLLRGFDLFVMSSLQEGLCSSLIDAMAASRAAVATRVGGVQEVMLDGETGFLVPAADPMAMAQRIVQLLRDSGLRHRMGEAGLARARESFTLERMVNETLAGYQKALAARRTR